MPCPPDRSASASALAARITDAQGLAGTALRLFLTLSPRGIAALPYGPAAPSPRRADRQGRAQDAAAELSAALACAVENQRRQADAASRWVVLIGPTPQQFIESAADLLDRIPTLCDAVSRDWPESSCH
ncbi:hypothetical protein [Streptomyces mutabilis]|uniref:hypothetical protein n=1 Tax=Streptomyces mutabilis TaxID=67332 RepID=UPI0036750F5F